MVSVSRYERDAIIIFLTALTVPFFAGAFSYQTPTGLEYPYLTVLSLYYVASGTYLSYRVIRRLVGKVRGRVDSSPDAA